MAVQQLRLSRNTHGCKAIETETQPQPGRGAAFYFVGVCDNGASQPRTLSRSTKDNTLQQNNLGEQTMLTKPYDEVRIPLSDFQDLGSIILRVEKLKEYLKHKYYADELELFEDTDTMDYVVRYKRNQLQYG